MADTKQSPWATVPLRCQFIIKPCFRILLCYQFPPVSRQTTEFIWMSAESQAGCSCFHWQAIYSLNELRKFLNSWEPTLFNWKWIKILNSFIYFSVGDRCPNLSLSSTDWFPFNFCFSRPGLLNAGDPSYPWLADSWPATSLPVNNSNSGPNEIGNFGRGGKLCIQNFVICFLGFPKCFKKYTLESIFFHS